MWRKLPACVFRLASWKLTPLIPGKTPTSAIQIKTWHIVVYAIDPIGFLHAEHPSTERRIYGYEAVR